MFAAAAIVFQTTLQIAKTVALWIATKIFFGALLIIVLPWVLRGFFIWAIEYASKYREEIGAFFADFTEPFLGAITENMSVDLEVSGVGAYLAIQTGLIDYAAIIFTGWGVYWSVVSLRQAMHASRWML